VHAWQIFRAGCRELHELQRAAWLRLRHCCCFRDGLTVHSRAVRRRWLDAVSAVHCWLRMRQHRHDAIHNGAVSVRLLLPHRN
jgi:hypothetical protein